MNKQFGKVQQFITVSHSGAENGPVFHDSNGKATQFTQQEIKNLKINWSNSATAKFFGCNTSNFASNFANAQGVTSYGYSGYAYFSNDPNKMVPDQGGGKPLYLIDADYGSHSRSGGMIRYTLGRGIVYPMVRHNLPPKDKPRR